jgi:hypothetical protein
MRPDSENRLKLALDATVEKTAEWQCWQVGYHLGIYREHERDILQAIKDMSIQPDAEKSLQAVADKE